MTNIKNIILKYRKRIIIIILLAAALSVTYFIGGRTNNKGGSTRTGESRTIQSNSSSDKYGKNSEGWEDEAEEKTEKAAEKAAEKEASEYSPETDSERTPEPVEPENTVITDKKLTCTLSVRCDTVLRNMDKLDPEKAEIIPSDGVIFSSKAVTFSEGESVFDVLLREMKNNKIHMEFSMTPVYNSAYIEGINNLYEFDCGELSGWMYKVNGRFPNYGCSKYALKQGDIVEWVYSCDLGKDVGNSYASEGGR